MWAKVIDLSSYGEDEAGSLKSNDKVDRDEREMPNSKEKLLRCWRLNGSGSQVFSGPESLK